MKTITIKIDLPDDNHKVVMVFVKPIKIGNRKVGGILRNIKTNTPEFLILN